MDRHVAVISTRLYIARERSGLSQEKAADLIGRERKMLSRYEDPRRDSLPRLDVAKKLADVYHVDLSFFVGKEDS